MPHRVPLLLVGVLGVVGATEPVVQSTEDAKTQNATVGPLRIDGLVAAVHSPFDEDFALDLAAVPAQRAWLRATGVDWVYVGGTTGESLSLTTAERMALAEAWCDVSPTRAPDTSSSQSPPKVIVHVGAEAVRDAVALAAHAERIGAHAIGAMPPSFFKPATVDALAATVSAICRAAPSLPCYYYHIPSKTGVDFRVVDLVGAIDAAGATPTFAGVKYTGLYDLAAGGYPDAERVLAYAGGRYEVLGGREEMLLQSLAIGITGHVGSQFTLVGDLYAGVLAEFAARGLTADNADALRATQLRALDLLDVQAGAPAGMNALKRLVTYAGMRVGDARAPFVPFDDDADASLRAAADAFCAAPGNADLRMCGALDKEKAAAEHQNPPPPGADDPPRQSGLLPPRSSPSSSSSR
mmetsp:Transcript_16760/g.67624  ORF Transcript_16760/g.67624 Transcript_16760/m.67624 type:complete len:410 (+) Transcript_16760:62-1291(+)